MLEEIPIALPKFYLQRNIFLHEQREDYIFSLYIYLCVGGVAFFPRYIIFF